MPDPMNMTEKVTPPQGEKDPSQSFVNSPDRISLQKLLGLGTRYPIIEAYDRALDARNRGDTAQYEAEKANIEQISRAASKMKLAEIVKIKADEALSKIPPEAERRGSEVAKALLGAAQGAELYAQTKRDELPSEILSFEADRTVGGWVAMELMRMAGQANELGRADGGRPEVLEALKPVAGQMDTANWTMKDWASRVENARAKENGEPEKAEQPKAQENAPGQSSTESEKQPKSKSTRAWEVVREATSGVPAAAIGAFVWEQIEDAGRHIFDSAKKEHSAKVEARVAEQQKIAAEHASEAAKHKANEEAVKRGEQPPHKLPDLRPTEKSTEQPKTQNEWEDKTKGDKRVADLEEKQIKIEERQIKLMEEMEKNRKEEAKRRQDEALKKIENEKDREKAREMLINLFKKENEKDATEEGNCVNCGGPGREAGHNCTYCGAASNRDPDFMKKLEQLGQIVGVSNERQNEIGGHSQEEKMIPQMTSEKRATPENLPKNAMWWVEMVRHKLQTLRTSTEPPYAARTWREQIEEMINPSYPANAPGLNQMGEMEGLTIKEQQGNNVIERPITGAELASRLVLEAERSQQNKKMEYLFLQMKATNEGLAGMLENMQRSQLEWSSVYFNGFRDMLPSRVPKYMQEAFGGRESVSMSEKVDRAMFLKVGFMSEWAELQNEVTEWVAKESVRKWKAGEFKSGNQRDNKKWDDWLKGAKEVACEMVLLDKNDKAEWSAWNNDLSKRKIDYRGLAEKMESHGMPKVRERFKRIESKYSGYLGWNEENGLVPAEIVKNFLSEIPESVRTVTNGDKDVENNIQKVSDDIAKGKGIRLGTLLGGHNVFAEGSSKGQQVYWEWMISKLSGDENEQYAQSLALGLARSTLATTRLNSTGETSGMDYSAASGLEWPFMATMSDATRMAVTYNRHIAGRVPPMLKTYFQNQSLEFTVKDSGREKTVKKSIEDCIRDGMNFTNLPFAQTSSNPESAYFVLSVGRAITDQKQFMDMAKWEDVSDMEKLGTLIKPFETAFGDWRDQDEKYAGKTLRERRNEWAGSYLSMWKTGVVDTKKLGLDEWSPWVSWAVGTIMDHHPRGCLLINELSSPVGAEAQRTMENNRWARVKPKTVYEGPSYARVPKLAGKVANVPEFLDVAYSAQMLTANEAKLVHAIVSHEARDDWGLDTEVEWKLPRT